jgi:hypothetical protein
MRTRPQKPAPIARPRNPFALHEPPAHEQGRRSDTVIDGYRHHQPAQPAWRVAVTLTATAEFAEHEDALDGYEDALVAKYSGVFPPDARVELERWLPEAGIWLPCVWATEPSGVYQ